MLCILIFRSLCIYFEETVQFTGIYFPFVDMEDTFVLFECPIHICYFHSIKEITELKRSRIWF